MALIRWEPFGAMEDMFNRMLSQRYAGQRGLGESNGERELVPSADISETDKEYLIRAELPAVAKEDVRVTADEGTITIQGERKHKTEQKDERFHRVESVYGTFWRTFSLPTDADSSAIRCESKDGVLTVHIPKRPVEKAKARQIKVE